MDFVHELSKKPWLSDPGGAADSDSGTAFHLPAEKIALRIFLTVVTVLFSLTVIVYSDRMVLADWRPLPKPWLLWVNTVLLMLGSAALQWAVVNARRGHIDGVRAGMHAAGILTFAFLVGQLSVGQQLIGMGYFADSGIAAAFFYLLTAMHAVHLFGGLVAWGRTAARMWRGHEAVQLRLSIELCAIYWHYLLVLWLVLFGLLLLT